MGSTGFCLGANLARLELRGIYGHLLERLEEIRVDGDVERLGSGLIGGIKRLPISYVGSWGVAEALRLGAFDGFPIVV